MDDVVSELNVYNGYCYRVLTNFTKPTILTSKRRRTSIDAHKICVKQHF